MAIGHVRISTEGLKPDSAKKYWADHVGEACHNLEFNFQRDESFEATAEYTDLGVGKLTHFKMNGAHKTLRLPRHIARDKEDAFYIAYMRDGCGGISSIGKDLDWKKGCVYFGITSDPYKFHPGAQIDFSIIFLKMAYVRQTIAHPEGLFMSELRGSSGWRDALTSMMCEMTPRTVDQLALPASTVIDHLLGLLALAGKPACDDMSTSRRALLDRLRRDMRERLFDAPMTPAVFSAEHGIAVRTLHAAFAASGTSFMNELIGLRLDRARVLLDDRGFDGKTISEIATLVGFTNADHFSARFRKSFGMSPRLWRNRNK
jgi:AraC-like DNA-binding protein